MQRKYLVALAVSILLVIAYAGPDSFSRWIVQAQSSGQRNWGQSQIIVSHMYVGNNDEIGTGNTGYVFQKCSQPEILIDSDDWEAMLNGDFSIFKTQMESQVPGSKAVWIKVAWDYAAKLQYQGLYLVRGLYIEAIVKNINAGLTGIEIVYVIYTIALFIFVVGFFILTAYVTWRIMTAAEALGPVVTIGIGLVILILIIFAILLVFGVQIRKTKHTLKIGKK